MTCIHRRITWLLGVFAVLAAAPLIGTLIPLSTATLPMLWAAHSLQIGELMVLALWAGIGNSRILWRLVGLVGGCAYLSVWYTISEGLRISGKWDPVSGEWDPVRRYMRSLAAYLIVGFLIGGVFAVMRRWFQIRESALDESTHKQDHMQFSVFHLLVLMSFVAIVLSLMRAARGAGSSDWGTQTGQWSAAYGLGIFTFIANTACAGFAAMGRSSVTRNCLLVLLASILLGTAIAFSLRQDQVGAWFFAGGILAMVLPTISALAALLWLRPCGLRLVRRQ